ncbi:YlxM family DNA-binding protein [Anoxynatronum sibiricum]
MMDKNTGILLLYDCYQALLTEKQRQMMDLYYNQDFTLAEIAEEMTISRQGVYDHLKRTEKLLEQYEERMSLLKIFQRQSGIILQMKECLAKMEVEMSGVEAVKGSMTHIKRIKSSLEQLNQISTS